LLISMPKCKELNSELILVLASHPSPRPNTHFFWGEKSVGNSITLIRFFDKLNFESYRWDDIGETWLHRKAILGTGLTLELIQVDRFIAVISLDQLLDDFGFDHELVRWQALIGIWQKNSSNCINQSEFGIQLYYWLFFCIYLRLFFCSSKSFVVPFLEFFNVEIILGVILF